jgi:hypothetical protein
MIRAARRLLPRDGLGAIYSAMPRKVRPEAARVAGLLKARPS